MAMDEIISDNPNAFGSHRNPPAFAWCISLSVLVGVTTLRIYELKMRQIHTNCVL